MEHIITAGNKYSLLHKYEFHETKFDEVNYGRIITKGNQELNFNLSY